MLLPLGDNLERPNFPMATVTLILINVAIFVIASKMDLTGSNLVDTGDKDQARHVLEVKEFYNTWGAVPANLAKGEIIGVLTYMFLHGSLMHLIGNMLILWVFGQSLESAMGAFAFVVAYIFWGIVACVAHCAMDFESEIFLIGASGSIAGVLGGYMTMFGYQAKIRMFLLLGVFPFKFFMPASVFGFFWIMQQMYNASIDIEGSLTGVAWMAHVGGFGIGLFTMLIFRNASERVLIKQGDVWTFGSREEIQQQRRAADPEAAMDIDLDDESCVVEIKPRCCTACGVEINKSHRIGDRLLRCPNKTCGQLAYLTDDDLRPEYVG